MSDNFLLFVPIDPYWQPTQENADRAVEVCRKIAPRSDEVTAEFFDDVVCHHPYANWDGAWCPACDANLDDCFYDAVAKDLSDLKIVTPCCGYSTVLNELRFGWPTALGRFVLNAQNPGVLFSDEQLRAMEDCVGSKLQMIWRHL